MEAHILAVADAYQNLISAGDGKSLSPDQAQREIVAGAGQRFNAGVVEAFTKMVGGQARGAGA
jgi:HD-GYP domain-containing protein (c-di-GMP phosphodiesterase class II)